MEESKLPHGPVPLPRIRVLAKTPVPLPRTALNVTSSDDKKNDQNEKNKPEKTRLEHTNSLRKSLKKVTNNVQEKSNAVFLSAKNVSSKMESSVRNILSKRHTITGLEEPKQENIQDDDYGRCQSLPCDDIFRDISFDSPMSIPDDESLYSDPPSYPPPSPPDDSHYDQLRPKSCSDATPEVSRTSSDVTPEMSVVDNASVYEEIHGLNRMSGACSPTHSSVDDSNSWNYYDIPFSISKPRGHSYENVAMEYLPTESSQNIYSEEPAKGKVYKKPVLFPSDTSSVCSSKVVTNKYYENWEPSTNGSNHSTTSRSEKSFATKSVIYEFDPLFVDRSSKPPLLPRNDQHDRSTPPPITKRELAESSNNSGELQKSSTVPADLNKHDRAADNSENGGEYFVYHRSGACKGLLDDEPKEIPVLTQGKKKGGLVRWDSMKRAIKMVTDTASWSPIMARRSKDSTDVKKLSKLGNLHNGYLFKSPSNGEKAKDFVKKWCQLADGNITLSVEKNSVSKESIGLETILSIQTVTENKHSIDGELLHCWELSTSCRTKPYMFGNVSLTECRLWMRTILDSLANVFPASVTAEFHRAGQCFLKEGVSSDWCGAWILLIHRTLYYCQIEGQVKEIDLRRARCIVLSEDEGKCFSTSESGPYIKVHTVEEVLYIQMDFVRESKAWFTCIKTAALENGTALSEQQLTKDGVPVIVDKCINFVYAHGSMSEGIYRRSGASSKVSTLLSLLRKDAWDVQISRQDYGEHEVSSVLKRFFRDLPEPLLTASLYKYLCNAAVTRCSLGEKEAMYRSYLGKLPQVNYVTLRRLIGHFYCLHNLSDKNKMPVENLAAIWGPTLMHVEGKEGMQYTKRECDVIADLICSYKAIFQVEDEESDRERRILEALERVHDTVPLPRPSGDLKIAIYIHSKLGEAVIIPVNPSVDSGKVCIMLAEKTDYSPNELCLTECVLNGTLYRPLHHTESVLDTVLRWAYWDTVDSRENYLLLTHNVLYKEVMPLTKPPMSKSGELKFADKKSKSFKNFMFEFSQAKLRCYKDKACASKLNEWKIEDIIWYIGHEQKRNPQSRWAITFIEKKDPPRRTKEYPYFGYTIAGTTKEDHLQWVAAMLVGQYQHSDLLLKPPHLI